MANALDLIQILDNVLAWFAMEPDEYINDQDESRENVTEAEIVTYMTLHYPSLSDNKYFITNITLVLQKLAEDGYLNRDRETNPLADRYSATIKGKVFIKIGGYSAEKMKNENLIALQYSQNQLSQTQTELQIKMKILTMWVAVGTSIAAAYYLLEILKHFHLIF